MRILIPLAGRDKRFELAGQLKPLVKARGKPLVKLVTRCLPFPLEKIIFVCLKTHDVKFHLAKQLRDFFGSKITIVKAEQETEGALCSALLAQPLIDNEEDLLIDLADIFFTAPRLRKDILDRSADIKGIIPVAERQMDKPWGYVEMAETGYVKALNEKEIVPSSNLATLGLYYFSHGEDFIWAAQEMLKKNIRTKPNNLFYIGPAYNQLIARGDKIITSQATIKAVLGSPEDIKSFKQANIDTHSASPRSCTMFLETHGF